jgi:acyl carrier protein
MLSRATRAFSILRAAPSRNPVTFLCRLQGARFQSFATQVSPSARIHDAIREFIDLRKSELEQYEAVDTNDREETQKLIDQLSYSRITEETTWASLGFDGLDEVEVVLAIEQALGITLPDEEFHTIRSVADAVNVFSKYTPKQG